MRAVHLLLSAALGAVVGAASAQTTPSTIEYWLDGNFSERTSLPMNGETAFSLRMSDSFVGVHSLGLRVSDNEGRWSSPQTHYFVRTATYGSETYAKPTVVEYWTDDAYSSRKSVPAADAKNILLDMSGSFEGIHSVSLRVQDSRGAWSVPEVHYFAKSPTTSASNTLTEYRFWIDENFNNAIVGSVGTDGIVSLDLALSDLPKGLHSLSVSFADSKGALCAPMRKFFVVPDETLLGNAIAGFNYWFNSGKRLFKAANTPAAIVEISNAEFVLANVKPNEIPKNYTFDVASHSVLCDDNVHFGMQAIDAHGNASGAVLSDNFAMQVPVVLEVVTLPLGETTSLAAQGAGEIAAVKLEASAGDSILFAMSGGSELDVYDASGTKLTYSAAENYIEDGLQWYHTFAPTTEIYLLVHHTPLVENAVTVANLAIVPTKISLPTASPTISTSSGMLWIDATAEAPLRVVTLSGVTVASEVCPAGKHAIALERGAYLVQLGGDGYVKVIVP